MTLVKLLPGNEDGGTVARTTATVQGVSLLGGLITADAIKAVAQETYKGFTIKVTEFYDGVNDNSIMRLDVLFGWAATYPELAVKYAT